MTNLRLDYWGYWQQDCDDKKNVFFVKVLDRAENKATGTILDRLGVAQFTAEFSDSGMLLKKTYASPYAGSRTGATKKTLLYDGNAVGTARFVGRWSIPEERGEGGDFYMEKCPENSDMPEIIEQSLIDELSRVI